MPRRLAVLSATVALALAGCAATAVPYDPYKVPRDEFYPSLKVVAMAPVRVPKDLQGADEVKARFTALVDARLRAAGLQVVPPDETGPVLEAAVAAQGGLYDPGTGQLDAAKAEAALRDAAAQLSARHRADAVLWLDVVVVEAALQADVARWDGVTDQVRSAWMTLLAGGHSGRVPALSLVARLWSPEGRLLYAKAGGLRVLFRAGSGDKPVPVPHAELFADPLRNENAVRLALDPLLAPAPSGPAPAPAADRAAEGR